MSFARYISCFGFYLLSVQLVFKIVRRLFPNPKSWNAFNLYRHKLIKSHLTSISADTLMNLSEPVKVVPSKYVWVFWWQGELNAPNLVKGCINSIVENSKGWTVVVISKDNLSEYLELPSCITDKIDNEITITHLSDIIRFNLQYMYGGMWLDATTFMSANLPNINLEHYWTTKQKLEVMLCVSKARWNGAIMYCPKHHIFAEFMSKCFTLYWDKYNILIDYFLVDYFTELAYEKILLFQNELDSLEINNDGVYLLSSILNNPIDENRVDSLLLKNTFHKLQRRMAYTCVNKNGQKTNYSYFYNYIFDGKVRKKN